MANEGALVVIADVNKSEGEETVKRINDNKNSAVFIQTDVRDESSIKNLMQEANKWGGNKGIRILVNNAVAFVFGHLGGAGTGSKSFTDKNVEIAEWHKVLDTNVIGYAK